MDQLEAIRTFVAVAEQRSFVEAARSRGISPTAASRAVSELEARLGVVLLRRTTRTVLLTQQGATYLERSRHALEELDDAARGLRGDNADPKGDLIITAPVVFGRLHVLPVALAMMRRYPELTVRLMLTDRVVRLVEEGVDIAVRIADLSDSALRAARVGETRRVLVASPSYLKERGTPQQVTDLHGHDLIAFDNFALSNEWRFGKDGRQVIRLKPRLFTNSVDAAIEAVITGAGIARILSYQVDAHVKAGSLAYVLPDQDPPPVPISLLFQANRGRSANVRAFIEWMRRADVTLSLKQQ